MRIKLGCSKTTLEVFKGVEKQIADETEWGLSYIYAIMAGREPDPFAKMEWLFKRICRVSLERAQLWHKRLGALLELEARRQNVTVVECPLRRFTREVGEALAIIHDPQASAEAKEKEVGDVVLAGKDLSAAIHDSCRDRDGETEIAVLFDGPLPTDGGSRAH